MLEQIKIIKDNNYMLPTIEERMLIENKGSIRKAISFDNELVNTSGKYSWE